MRRESWMICSPKVDLHRYTHHRHGLPDSAYERGKASGANAIPEADTIMMMIGASGHSRLFILVNGVNLSIFAGRPGKL
jgi:hypothetical protein